VKSLSIVNFLSIANVCLHFPETGLIDIVGLNKDEFTPTSNAAGKSSLLDSVFWCLYGVTARGAKGEDIIRENCSEAVVIVDMGKFSVTRTQTGNKATVSINIEGEPSTPYKLLDANKKIEELLGMDEDLFHTLFYMSQGFNSKFSSYSETDRTELIERLMDSKKITDALSRASISQKNCQNEIQKLQGEKLGQEESVRDIAARIESLKVDRESKKAEAIATKKILQDEVAAFRSRIDVLNSELVQVNILYNDAINTVKLEEPKKKLLESDWGYAISSLASLTAEMSSLRDKLSVYQESVCGTCSQPISKELAKSKSVEILSAMEKKTKDMQDFTLKRNSIRGDISAIDEIVRRCRVTSTDSKDRIARINREIAELSSEIRSREERSVYMDLGESDGVALLETSIVEMRGRLTEIERKLSEEEYILPYYNFWVEGYSPRGIRSLRLDGLLDQINDHLESLCLTMFSGERSLKLMPEKEYKGGASSKSCVTLKVINGRSYANSSGSEKRRMDLALHIALRRVFSESIGMQLPFLFADEITDTMDTAPMECVLRVIEEVSRDSLVFIISHSEELKSRCSRVSTYRGLISVEKEHGVSSVAYKPA